jgi:hypothetical protein
MMRVWNKEEKNVDFGTQRVTSMKSCRRVFLPKPLEGRVEGNIETLTGGLEDVMRRQEEREKNIKVAVYIEQEERGTKSIKEREKKGEGIMATSDISRKKIFIETSVYEKKMEPHVKNDTIVTIEYVKDIK